MKKEYIAVLALSLIALSYVMNYLAGPVSLPVNSPVSFVSNGIYAKFPFTATEILFRTLGIFSTIILVMSFMGKAYFLKSLIVFALGALGELFAIQQLAISGRVLPVQWTLAIAYTAPLLLIPLVYFLIRGIVQGVHSSISEVKNIEKPSDKGEESETTEGKSNDFWTN